MLITELAKVRIEIGLRQEDVASLLRVPQSFVSKYENGERRLDLIETIEICECLNTSINDLIEKIK